MNFKKNSVRFLIWWSKLKLYKFISFTLLMTYIILIPLIPFIEPVDSFENRFDYIRIISAITFAPFFETLIFQALVIFIIKRFLTKNFIVLVLISACFFGIIHFYNVYYVIYAMFLGLIFASGYILYLRNKSWEDAALAIMLVHALRNSIAIIISFILR